MRQTQGFGQNRASKSASVNAQYGVDLTDADHLRVFAAAYGTQSELPGSVREDEVNAGRIGKKIAISPISRSARGNTCIWR